MTDMITIFCLVHGDDPARDTFPVTISNMANVDELRHLIHTTKGCDNGDSTRVLHTLWKVSISMDRLLLLPRYFNFKTNGVELSPLGKLRDVFVYTPAEGYIHIIAELPYRTPSPPPGNVPYTLPIFLSMFIYI